MFNKTATGLFLPVDFAAPVAAAATAPVAAAPVAAAATAPVAFVKLPGKAVAGKVVELLTAAGANGMHVDALAAALSTFPVSIRGGIDYCRAHYGKDYIRNTGRGTFALANVA